MAYLSEASRQIDQQIQGLDLPRELANEAVAEYLRIASWLGAPGSPLAQNNLDLYPQGSFRLGTPIRPISREDEFDVDLVCHLEIAKEAITQAQLKALVGGRLKADPAAWGKLEERRRCWTLFYKGKFHLDVLPTIPDADHRDTGLLLTDTDLVRWQFSNPLGYAHWFYERMRTTLQEERSVLAKSMRVDIESVPEWSVRTPLQRAVQVLKRHRDIFFIRDIERRPVSIVITTLAGRAYQNEPDLAQALVEIVEGLDTFIEMRDGKWWIPNPAHEKENFADKWNEKPALRDAFLRWRDQVHLDIESLLHTSTSQDANAILEKSLHGRSSTGTPAVGLAGLKYAPIPDVDTLSHRQAPPWPKSMRYGCTVAKQAIFPSGAGKVRMAMPATVPKRTKLLFTARTDTPEPYQVFWQVTNTGHEARDAGQLRGEIRSGDGRLGASREETASYFGTHIVQAFVVKDERLVAVSDEVRVRIAKK